jgi:hypothetical protein
MSGYCPETPTRFSDVASTYAPDAVPAKQSRKARSRVRDARERLTGQEYQPSGLTAAKKGCPGRAYRQSKIRKRRLPAHDRKFGLEDGQKSTARRSIRLVRQWRTSLRSTGKSMAVPAPGFRMQLRTRDVPEPRVRSLEGGVRIWGEERTEIETSEAGGRIKIF